MFTCFMQNALEVARQAIDINLKSDQLIKNLDFEEVPVGAVIVHNERIIAKAHNLTRNSHDPTAHAEIIAIRKAALKLRTSYLIDCSIYVTLEPCAMCAQALLWSRISKLYFGAYNLRCGAIESKNNNYSKLEAYGGIKEQEASKLLIEFFSRRR